MAALRPLLLVAAVGLLPPVPAAPGASLELSLRPTFAGDPIQLNSIRYETSAKETFSITRVSYLLSGFALQRVDGSWLELTNQVAWLDLEKSRATHRLPGLPPGSYQAIRFDVGLDEKLNHADPAQFAANHPLNPSLNGLHWSWQGGYIFMALEGLWHPGSRRREEADRQRFEDSRLLTSAATNTLNGWSYHFANDTNRTRITLAVALPLTNDTKLNLDLDLAALINSPRPLSFGRDGTSSHSRAGDPVAIALGANLPAAFRVRRVEPVAARPAEVASVSVPLYLPEKFTPYRFQMSATFPLPELPRDNPLTEERVALGKQLFRETKLSKNGSLSCASCHEAAHAFADPRRYSIGVRDQVGVRNAMPLFNLAWRTSFFWDGRAPTLRAQALMPIQDHTEMDESLTNVVAKLSATGRPGSPLPGALPETSDGGAHGVMRPATNHYPALFTSAFGSPEITSEKIGLALETFMLTLTSFDSKFDRALKGESQFSAEEQRGFELFMTEYDPRRQQYGADCFHCHGGPLFQSQTFANNGLDAEFTDRGRAKVTGKDSDAGKFAAPSLRNIALTAPYMHDGRFATLEEVIEHYSSGVKQSATLDPNLAKHPDGGVPLSAEDKRALVALLRTLTDPQFVTMPTGRTR